MTTSESTPPAHATWSTRPAPSRYLSTRWGLTVTGAPGCRRYWRTVCQGCTNHVCMLRGRNLIIPFTPRIVDVAYPVTGQSNGKILNALVQVLKLRGPLQRQLSKDQISCPCHSCSVTVLRSVTVTSEASAYFREVRYRTAASTLSSIRTTFNQAISPTFTLPKGNFACNQYQSIFLT